MPEPLIQPGMPLSQLMQPGSLASAPVTQNPSPLAFTRPADSVNRSIGRTGAIAGGLGMGVGAGAALNQGLSTAWNKGKPTLGGVKTWGGLGGLLGAKGTTDLLNHRDTMRNTQQQGINFKPQNPSPTTLPGMTKGSRLVMLAEIDAAAQRRKSGMDVNWPDIQDKINQHTAHIPAAVGALAGIGAGGALYGAPLGGWAGLGAGSERGHPVAGASRGVLRGAATGGGAALGGALGAGIGNSLQAGPGYGGLAGGAAGSLLGGLAGWLGSGALLGEPKRDK